jgi:Domain of unknown function (DUF1844)
MAKAEKGEERGFTVVDRRGDDPEQAGPRTTQDDERALPVDFSSFCISLGTSALYHLGVVGDPETGEKAPAVSRPLARHTIGALEMLRDKTRGNLDDEERRMLESLLYELHMRYVESGKTGS